MKVIKAGEDFISVKKNRDKLRVWAEKARFIDKATKADVEELNGMIKVLTEQGND